MVSSKDKLLMTNINIFYKKNPIDNVLDIIKGKSKISLRLLDWFVTNYAKKNYTVYNIDEEQTRFKVYNDYKLKLKAYSKKRFDPFCRWERITIPYDQKNQMETTIGQLNFFKWAIENKILDYIDKHYSLIEADMNTRNSTSKKRGDQDNKTRKKREELSVSACKCIKKEDVKIVVKFN